MNNNFDPMKPFVVADNNYGDPLEIIVEVFEFEVEEEEIKKEV